MREIKFRAWHKRNKEFYNWGVGNIDGNGGLGTFPSDLIYLEHQQYTGLKDKNGVEIYEGDIMKAKRHNFEDYEICVIVYKPISFVFEVQSEKGNYIAPRNWHQHFEVIGNIYENTELLK